MRTQRLILRLLPGLLGSVLLGLISLNAWSDSVTVAVASNFKPTARKLSRAFEQQTGHNTVLVSGSTGSLYAQISLGAQHDIFLAADQKRPQLLVDTGLANKDNLIAYAQGLLVLIHPSATTEPLTVPAMQSWLRAERGKIATANPNTAPYGEAAQQVLENLQLWHSLQARLVRGNNVGQTFQLLKTGNCKTGFIALSQALADATINYGLVPQILYKPLIQSAVILRHGEARPAVLAYFDFLASKTARDIIQQDGYSIPQDKD